MEAKAIDTSKENVLSNMLSIYTVRQITLWCLDVCRILLAMLISLQLTEVNNS